MSFSSRPLISLTDKGLYCEAGNFYIDPHRSVELAVVTHAHSDHARRGSHQYICEKSGLGLLRSRLGKIEAYGFPYQESFELGPVKVSFHSAGHILGSAQVRIEHEGEVWVITGDYKREPDPTCVPFESVKCDVLITEATFGTPQYTWDKDPNHGKSIFNWWKQNQSEGKNSVLFGYSLGKAQRILGELAPYADRPIVIHSTITELTECYRKEGIQLAATRKLDEDEVFKGELVLAPPSILKETWARNFGKYSTAFASGWMQNGNGWGRGSYDHGFVMSDHADWNDLNLTIEQSGASRVFVQHRNGALVRHLRKKGMDAHPDEALKLENYTRLAGRNLDLFGGIL